MLQVVCWPDSKWPALTDEPASAATAAAGRVHFRALCDIPAGTEILSSYTPLGWPVAEALSGSEDESGEDMLQDRGVHAVTRQTHLSAHYGFICRCPRCALELRVCTEPADTKSRSEEEELRLTLWLLRHVCAVDGCGGTMVPPGPDGALVDKATGRSNQAQNGGLRGALGHLVDGGCGDARGMACNGCGRVVCENEYWEAVERDLLTND
eukprot:SAG31_NODE_1672_length_7564_cov_10.193704_1_plen_210_part_00